MKRLLSKCLAVLSGPAFVWCVIDGGLLDDGYSGIDGISGGSYIGLGKDTTMRRHK